MIELSDDQIKLFLEQEPLYVTKKFKRPSVNRGDLQIKEIEAYCEKCSLSRPFKSMHSRGMAVEAVKTGTTSFNFICVSCGKSVISIKVHQIVDDIKISLMKFGELPRKKLVRDPLLQKFFADDKENFEKAITCQANGYGIAAFAYFRRIIESNIYKLLDLLQNDIESAEADQSLLEAIAELRLESPMSDKIKIANRALPKYLIPQGLNPLGRLYQVLSEGIHQNTDLECLEKSEQVKECIRFLVSELSSRASHREKFKAVVSKL